MWNVTPISRGFLYIFLYVIFVFNSYWLLPLLRSRYSFLFKPQKKSHIFQRFLDDNEIVHILGKNLFIFIYDHLIAYYWFYCKIRTKKSICFLLKYFLIIRVGFKLFFFIIDAADRNGMRYEYREFRGWIRFWIKNFCVMFNIFVVRCNNIFFCFI